MKKKYYKTIDYKVLFFSTVKEKYFNLLLGMAVSLVISSFGYKFFFKNFFSNIALSFPSISKKAVSSTVKPKIEVKSYTVQEGDDLWHISEKFYGSGFNAYDVSLTNNIDPESTLETGQKLIIPDVKRKEATIGEISSASTSQVTYTEGKYVVQPGDSLSTIAFKVYGDIFAWPRLLQANKLLNANQIEVGMTLTIPR